MVYNDNTKQIEIFRVNDKSPIESWLFSLDKITQDRIIKRLERIEQGNYGDFKRLDSEILEFRFKFGTGYRIYFAEVDNVIVLLLNAGDKSTQKTDIKKAKEYLKIWKGNNNEQI